MVERRIIIEDIKALQTIILHNFQREYYGDFSFLAY